MKKIREFLDRFLLSEFEWKKKYCPTFYKFVFGTEDEQNQMWGKMMENKHKHPYVNEYNKNHTIFINKDKDPRIEEYIKNHTIRLAHKGV